MFSEYASRFLAQSQSRLSNFQGQDNNNSNGNGTNTHNNDPAPQRQSSDWHQSRPYRQGGRSFLSAARGAGPYQPTASRFGNLTFASRYSTTQDAPLFHSELREEDDEDERDREAVDLFALQQSRRVFQPARLDESTEPEDEGSRGSLGHSEEQEESRAFLDRAHNRGIKSSWNGTRSSFARRERDPRRGANRGGHEGLERVASNTSSDSSGKGKMEDVGLDSVMANDNEPPEDLTRELSDEDNPPAFQKLRGTARPARAPTRRDSTFDSELGTPAYDNAEAGTAVAPPDSDIFKHDAFFAWVYLISLASMFATFAMVWLHTTAPSGSKPIGDTIYTVLQASFHLLAVDTLVAIIVSFVWLAALRYFVRPLVMLILVAVPVVMISFSIYPLVSSFQGPEHGSTFQDIIMRWASTIPGFLAVVWVYMVWKGRHSLNSSVAILEFSSRILGANNALVLVGLGALVSVVLWTWLWLAMFTRVFLGGSYSGTFSRYIIQASSWWLGAYFLIMYLWTLSMIAGVQRATTAATVSQWYFHRNAVPKVASREIVAAALNHAMTTLFGTISLSTLLAIVVRLPLLVLPRRAAGIITALFYTFMPTSIVALTNSLTLTYAAIHSQPLADSARGLSHMEFLGPQAPTTTLTPRAFRHRGSAPLLPYRLAKLLLHATRFIMATALGFAGWVMTARQLKIAVPEGSFKGSAYAYSVGIVASFIGWGVLGAMEGILSSIVDAVIICYGSETKMASGGGGYCMEAAQLFGGRGRGQSRDDVEY